MSCTHVEAADLKSPTPSQSVYRDDCTQCFDSIDHPHGLNVCLHCFNGGCIGDRNHALLHYEALGHPLVLNIRRKRKHIARDEPPQKLSKLAIAAETEEDRYEVTTRVSCYTCKIQDVDKESGKLPQVVNGVMKANTFAKQEEVKAWEQEITPCEHTLCLEQMDSRAIASQDLGQCAMCDLKENLWLCLTCGNLGCGRAQFGGVGGNSHALAHGDQSRHSVAVKLGSLTADGTADVYCYTCNDERADPELAAHLAHWGINIADRQKTEKSLTEMQIDQNMRWEFSMTTEDGEKMKPVFGSGFTGLKNLGNSCYLASVLQCLFDMPEFQKRYYHPKDTPPGVAKPAEDLETQLRKLADGLVSGRYSVPDSDITVSSDAIEIPHQKGLAPAMLKHLIGRGHVEFSTMRQQDAFEFLLHLLQMVSRSQHASASPSPVNAFKFVMEQRLQCLTCQRVRYREDEMENISIPVPIRRKSTLKTTIEGANYQPNESDTQREQFESVTFKECLDIFTAEERVDLECSGCGSKDGFSKQSLFKTFPEVLVVNIRRFEIVNWLPTKQDVPVIVGNEPISFDEYKSHGLQEDEETLPDDLEPAKSSQKFVPNELALSQLEAMGFPRVRCEKALRATGNSDAEAASNWLFEHMDDPDIDVQEEDISGSKIAEGKVDEASVEELGLMGFNAPQARQALKETNGNMERAVDWLFSHPDAQGDSDDASIVPIAAKPQEQESFGSDKLPADFQLQSIVCHKGASIHAGHYVAFIRKEVPDTMGTSWVLFNDEKVAKAADAEEMKKFAYIYFLRRV